MSLKLRYLGSFLSSLLCVDKTLLELDGFFCLSDS